jgi:DMSO/TMAO reductase YedYZ heme-binding membrane subunit
MAKYDFKDIGLAVLFSYLAITILNYIMHQAFNLPIIKTGIAILIFLIGIILGSLWVFMRDGKFEKSEIQGLVVVIILVAVIYFVIKMTLPELFSTIAPQRLQEVMDTAFSFLN